MANRTVSVALQLQIMGLQGVKNARTEVKGLKSEVQRYGPSAKRSAADHKSAMNDMAGSLGKVGLAAAAVGFAGVRAFANFDKAMSNVRAATHETAGNMKLLQDAALDAGKRTAFSATQAAGAIENLAKAGVSTRDILNGGLNGALALAAAGELDVAQAAETAATAMTQFHLSGKDVPHIADLLAAAAGKAQGEVSDMAQALNQSGLVASQMGLSIEETTGTLAAFASAGLLGSDAGTSFKTMLLRLANPAKEAADQMKALGIHAYDAKGAFIGVAPLAEQLRSKLKNLSQEQRDAALATIFGSDAIRAANVLYSQGAKGIVDWTGKVDDAGFAAETAALKQDNLRGDLEKLGGAFETFLIKLGEGGNGPFRSLIQGATGAVDKLDELPPSAKSAALAVASITAVSGLSAGGMLKVASAAGNVRESWQSLGRVGKTLTLSMGGVGLALGLAATVYGAFIKRNQEAKQEVDEFRDTLDKETGALTANTRALVAKKLVDSGVAQSAKDLGLNLPLVTDAILDNKSAMDALVPVLEAIIEKNTSIGKSGNLMELNEQGKSAQELLDRIRGLNGELDTAQTEHKLTAEAAKKNTTSQDALAAAMRKAKEKSDAEKKSLEELTVAAYKASGGALSLRDAENGYEEALDGVADSIKENGHTLDVHTEKGRANRETLDAIATSANDLTQSMQDNGFSSTAAGKKAEDARRNFVAVGIRMGLNKKAAEALAAKLIAIPAKADTKVTNDAEKAKAKAISYSDILTGRNKSGIPKTVGTTITNNGAGTPKTTAERYAALLTGKDAGGIPKHVSTAVATSGIPAAKTAIDTFATHVDKTLGGIADEAVRVSLFTSKAPGGHVPIERAMGGPVWGAGSETSDSIDARLSRNEHVVTAKEVRGAGGHGALKAMRRQWAQGLASGGPVGLKVTAATQSLAGIHAVTSSIAREFGAEIARQRAALGINPALNGALDFARAQAGKPYSWGAAGPSSYDCSGFLSAIVNFIQGRNPFSRRFSTASLPGGLFEPGRGAFSIGWFKGNPGHTAGTLNRVNVESRGGQGVVIGGGARGADNPLFDSGVYHLKGYAKGGPVGDAPFDLLDPRGKKFQGADLAQALGRGVQLRDRGGSIPTGTSLVQNNTGKLETIFNSEQQAAAKRAVNALTKQIQSLSGSIGKVATQIQGTAERIKSLVEQRNAFGAQAASSTSGDLFGSGADSAKGLRAKLDLDAKNATEFQKNLALLKKRGLNSDLWNKLAESSDFAAAAQLSRMGDLRGINASFKKRQDANAGLASFAGNARFGAQIRTEQDRLRAEQRQMKGLQSLLKKTQFEIRDSRGKKTGSLKAFDTGGILRSGQMGVNLSGQPERILSPTQTVTFDRMASGVGLDYDKLAEAVGRRIDGAAFRVDAGSVGMLTGHIVTTAAGVVNESNRQLKRRVGAGSH